MFNQSRLQTVLAQYKKDFLEKHWEEEKYKWEAVKTFQDNWDIQAKDFSDMLGRSLAKAGNLLTSMNNFPAGMIIGFAKAAPEEVRSMYMDLFDESKDVYERIGNFKKLQLDCLKNMEMGPNSIISMKMPLRLIYGCVIRINITHISIMK